MAVIDRVRVEAFLVAGCFQGVRRDCAWNLPLAIALLDLRREGSSITMLDVNWADDVLFLHGLGEDAARSSRR